jgi:hypothetical protein
MILRLLAIDEVISRNILVRCEGVWLALEAVT